MAKKHRFTRSVFRDGKPVFEEGKDYDITPETERQVRRGCATEVDVKDPAPAAAEAKKASK